MFSRAFACSLLLLIPFAGSASDMAGGRVPATARKPVTDEMHGVSITDNYRWLEDQQSPETRAWIKQQSNTRASSSSYTGPRGNQTGADRPAAD
ncbi:MAG: hypothetical protein ACJ73N_15790 [Bryobacteraceae bacterium]